MSSGSTTGGTPEKNRVPFTVSEGVEKFGSLAVESDIFPGEQKVFQRHFTDRDARVLDLGCGAGRTTRALADAGFDVTGIDISEEMVEKAADLFPDLDVRVGDAADLDFPDESFEYVLFSYGGLDFVQPESKRLTVLREVHRVLNPGGLFAFSSQNSLYSIPALFMDWSHIRNFYLNRANLQRLFQRYKVDYREYEAERYFINFFDQRRQLRDAGFEFVEYVGKYDGILQHFECLPHYVARKPE